MLAALFALPLLAGDALETESTYDFKAAPPAGPAWKFSSPAGGSAVGGPQGLALKTPANAAGKSAGATFPALLEGDFDAIADYELPADPKAPFAAPALEIVLSGSVRRLARLGLAGEAGKPAKHAAALGPDEPALYAKTPAGPNAGRGGRLQIQRRGGKWTWLAAAAGSENFETVLEESGSRSDLKEIALTLRGEARAGEVRFLRLILRGPPADGVPILETVEGKRIAAHFDYRPADAALALRTTPPAVRPLADLVAIVPGPVRGVRTRWAGQMSDEDFVGRSAQAGKNGVADARIDLSYLPTGKLKAARLAVVGGSGAWSTAPTGSDWRLHAERRGEGTSARIYFEPPAADLAGSLLALRLDFEDGSAAFAHAVAGPTDAKRKPGDKAPAPPPAAPEVRVHFVGDDALAGDLAGWSEAGLDVQTSWAGRLRIPRAGVRAVVQRGVKLPEASQAALDAQRAAPGPEDVAFVKDKDGNFQAVAGAMLGFAGGKVRFKLKGNVRTLDVERFAAVVLAAGAPAAPAGKEPRVTIALPDDASVSGGLLAFADGRATLRTAWAAALPVPWDFATRLSVVEGRQRYLSDMPPAKVEETPYFDRMMSWQRDKTLTGEPLKLRGASFAKGLALHSRTALSYELGGRYAEFRAKAGFDDAVPALGRVKLRFLGDGKELLVRTDFRADAGPEDLVVPLAGVRRFVVEVDFGADEDVCDRVILADARLLRTQ